MKLQTPVTVTPLPVGISYGEPLAVLGSCFADGVGRRLAECGFDVTLNPFGTLYNPVSICNAVSRLDSAVPFTEDDCVEMGAGASLICSLSHHTSFARETVEEFLQNANAALAEASVKWKTARVVIITLGTSWCYRYTATGETVANCLKISEKEFERYFLPADSSATLLSTLVARHPDKRFLFTVSPIRYLRDGAHGNQLSKSALLLAVEAVVRKFPSRAAYFPSYEIMMDELRDYRFWAEDMVHPSAQAEDYIFERLIEAALPEGERGRLEEARRTLARSRHVPGRKKMQ